MIKNITLVSIGAIAALAVPTFASSTNQSLANSVSLTSNQIDFIRQVDKGFKTNFSSLVNTPGANQIIKSASLACGNIPLQKQTILAMGANEQMATYASNKFQSGFCASTPQ